MAKRYYDAKKMSSRGLGPMRDSMISEGYYAGPDARFRQEAQDGGMIFEDPRAVANLPQEVIMRTYPRPGRATPENLNDTIGGIDRQISLDESKRDMAYDPDNKY